MDDKHTKRLTHLVTRTVPQLTKSCENIS